MTQEQDIRFSTHPTRWGDIGIITLNRPAALNALTHAMVTRMQTTLQEWQDNPNIESILLEAAGEKAFCAGGDIRQLYHAALVQDAGIFDFFSDEYRLNYFLANLKKPFVSLLNGITMGGGVGISQLGGQRIATEKYVFAMPETGIGFFPDVGGSYFLPRLPHHVGFYLALTGARIQADTALELGLIDYVIASGDLEAVKSLLLEFAWHEDQAEIGLAIKKYLVTPMPSRLSEHFSLIDQCFQAATMEEILARLNKIATPFAKATIDSLLQQSPTSLKVTLHQCQLGQQMNIGACLQMEYRMVQEFFKQPDFVEGIRAAIIDKDRQPNWQPNRIEAVTQDSVARYFEPKSRSLEL